MKWVSVKVFSFCWCCTCRWWRCWAPLHTARSTSTGLCFDCSRQTRPVPGAHSAPPPAPRPCVGDRYGGPPSHAWRRRVCWTGRQQKPWLNEKSLDWQCEMVHKGLLNNHSKTNFTSFQKEDSAHFHLSADFHVQALRSLGNAAQSRWSLQG